jgi:hypothetical protein
MTPCETTKYKGCSIKVYQDEDPGNPRDDDNLGTMLCKHRDYILGDRKRGEPEPTADEIVAVTKRDDVLWLPLYLLDHSGLAIRSGTPSDSWTSSRNRYHEDSAGWDVSTVGIIYVDFAKLREEYSTKRITPAIKKKAYHVLECEVTTYHSYLAGEVCGFISEDPDGNTLDSCWGFYPEDNNRGKERYHYMMEEARASIDSYVKKQTEIKETQDRNTEQILLMLG